METKLKSESKEKAYKPVYLRFGRGENTEAITLTPKIVEIISDALRDQTNKGDMTVTPLGRTDIGREQAEVIHNFLKLLQEKAD